MWWWWWCAVVAVVVFHVHNIYFRLKRDREFSSLTYNEVYMCVVYIESLYGRHICALNMHWVLHTYKWMMTSSIRKCYRADEMKKRVERKRVSKILYDFWCNEIWRCQVSSTISLNYHNNNVSFCVNVDKNINESISVSVIFPSFIWSVLHLKHIFKMGFQFLTHSHFFLAHNAQIAHAHTHDAIENNVIFIYRHDVSHNCIVVHWVLDCIISLFVWNVKCAVIQHE